MYVFVDKTYKYRVESVITCIVSRMRNNISTQKCLLFLTKTILFVSRAFSEKRNYRYDFVKLDTPHHDWNIVVINSTGDFFKKISRGSKLKFSQLPNAMKGCANVSIDLQACYMHCIFLVIWFLIQDLRRCSRRAPEHFLLDFELSSKKEFGKCSRRAPKHFLIDFGLNSN